MIKKIVKKDGSDVAVCPHCGEEIGCLFYETKMIGYGYAELDGRYNEEKGNEFVAGTAKWTCPECFKEVLPLKGAKSSL